ncbi:hypothetical protein [Aestuariivirga sp.]|uniref:hypothetical protein n=1 Tax=Aestuariivirga sp. TaxID=2650926 RepID=UPI003BAAC6D6
MTNFNHRTTAEAVELYQATGEVFKGLIREVRELSKKKPDAILSKGKVKIINRALSDLLIVLDKEPERKFLDLLDDEDLPQTSDAVLVMVQYESALVEFPKRYFVNVRTKPSAYGGWDHAKYWLTEKLDLSKFPDQG